LKIAPESKAFLVWLFTDLRKDLAERASEGGQGSPDPEEAVGQLAIFDALLTGLARGEAPDDEAVRQYVSGLAKSADQENEYERVLREHRALTELDDALAQRG
jgi:hypothetical protein